MRGDGVHVDSIAASAYQVPTTAPESDGTLEWTSTTLVLVEAAAAAKPGWATPTARST